MSNLSPQSAKELEDALLLALSFYTPMGTGQILMEMDVEGWENHDQLKGLSYQDLEHLLKKLERDGRVKRQGKGIDVKWLRVGAKRVWWRRWLLKWQKKMSEKLP